MEGAVLHFAPAHQFGRKPDGKGQQGCHHPDGEEPGREPGGFRAGGLDEGAHAPVQFLQEGLVSGAFGQVLRRGQEGVYIHRRAIDDIAGAAVCKEVAIVDAHRHHLRGPGKRALEGHAGNAFLQGLQFAARRMTAFREHAERRVVAQDILYLVHRLVIAQHIPDAVAAAHHRQDFQEAEDLGDGGLREDIGPGAEYGGRVAALQHHQRIHEGVRVVGADEYGLLGGDGALRREPAVAGPRAEIYIVSEDRIDTVPFPNLTHVCSG